MLRRMVICFWCFWILKTMKTYLLANKWHQCTQPINTMLINYLTSKVNTNVFPTTNSMYYIAINYWWCMHFLQINIDIHGKCCLWILLCKYHVYSSIPMIRIYLIESLTVAHALGWRKTFTLRICGMKVIRYIRILYALDCFFDILAISTM